MADLRDAHIIPEFLYKLTYDEKHRAELGSLETGATPETLQKGLREQLLCDQCEGLFSKLEHYASRVLFHKAGLRASTTGRVLTVTGVDYARFKLFLLSLLWRAGVSGLPAFNQVRLGPHEEVLRRQLLDSNPGPRHQYPCSLSAFTKHAELIRQTIIFPYSLRMDGHRAYRIVFAGLRCTYWVSGHVRPSQVRSGVMTEEGNLPVTFLSPEQEERFVSHIAERMPDAWLDDEL